MISLVPTTVGLVMSGYVITLHLMSASVISRLVGMGRWLEDAQGRLQHSALELFGERGFEQTTVADIADRAGVTERTFFRYFADKREVLFAGSRELQAAVVEAIASAPSTLSPLDTACGALSSGGSLFVRAYSQQRAAVIAANPSLHERELLKLATMGAAVAGALRARGVSDENAAVAAETAMTVFKLAFERWISDPGSGEFEQCSTDVLRQLRQLTG